MDAESVSDVFSGTVMVPEPGPVILNDKRQAFGHAADQAGLPVVDCLLL